ncbi:hypothetical protein Taro_009967, partial [Colocasia esculenta]|nr:hypothetical protein [Colocasia esculenta]
LPLSSLSPLPSLLPLRATPPTEPLLALAFASPLHPHPRAAKIFLLPFPFSSNLCPLLPLNPRPNPRVPPSFCSLLHLEGGREVALLLLLLFQPSVSSGPRWVIASLLFLGSALPVCLLSLTGGNSVGWSRWSGGGGGSGSGPDGIFRFPGFRPRWAYEQLPDVAVGEELKGFGKVMLFSLLHPGNTFQLAKGDVQFGTVNSLLVFTIFAFFPKSFVLLS